MIGVVSLHEVVTGPEGRRVVWRVAGRGRPLLLLHGGYGSWNHWATNIAGLAASAHVLVPDIPGLGASDDAEDPAALASIAAPLIDGLDALLGKGVALDMAAFSFGASVAAAIGLACPGRIERLILVGAGGLRAPRPPSVALENWRDASTEDEALAIHHRNLARFMFSDAAKIDSEAVAMQALNTRQARVKSRPLSRLGLCDDYLRSHTGTVDGIWGTADVTAMGHLDERRRLMQQADPGATLTEIAGVGHWVMREDPISVNAAIRQALDRPLRRSDMAENKA